MSKDDQIREIIEDSIEIIFERFPEVEEVMFQVTNTGSGFKGRILTADKEDEE